MRYFLQFWYVESFPWALQHYASTVASFEEQIAVGSTWKNIGKPLFQDYTFQGKIIGFFLRLMRIALGCLLYFLLALVAVFLYIFWLLFPALCVVSILGFFFAHPIQQSADTLIL